jgi:putative ABC transport system permease protein
LALYLEPGRDPAEVAGELRAMFADRPLVVRDNRTLRDEIFAVFDQTFAVTRLLQAMSLVVAVCGITLTLLVLARERAAELALYRSLGATRRQLFVVFVGQGLAMGALALAIGLLGGAVLAAILVFVINRAYFGWTIQPAWPWGSVLGQVAIILAAVAAASLYPALAASRVPAGELSRDA